MPNIYVLSKDGMPLMPIHSYGRVKHMLKAHKARVVNQKPFTIQLTYIIEDPKVDENLLGIDPGRTNIGLCVVDSKGRILYVSDVETRNKEIAKLMLKRKQARQASRRGERKRRQRRAIAADKTGMAKATTFYRLLPGCEKYVGGKVIRNQEARFNNRKRSKGWKNPTTRHLLETHIQMVKNIQKFLPINGIVLEINRFDFARMENPNIKNWQYQKGRLFGFKDVDEAVAFQQDGHCIFCKKKIDHYHHIVPRSKGGSESIENKAGLCIKHHDLVHKELEWVEKMKSKKSGIMKKYHALSVLNQIMPSLCEKLAKLAPLSVTTGYETKTTRDSYSLEKDHGIDAWCIAASALNAVSEKPNFDDIYKVKQFRKNDRALIHHQTERTYKQLIDGKWVTVAKNHRKRTAQVADPKADGGFKTTEQVFDSLHEWYLKTKQTYGTKEARVMQSQLKVIKSTRHYNNPDRILPGAEFLYRGKRYVLQGQITNGQYYKAFGCDKNIPSRDCLIIRRSGLVHM